MISPLNIYNIYIQSTLLESHGPNSVAKDSMCEVEVRYRLYAPKTHSFLISI